MRVPVVNAAVAYDCEYSGSTYILVINNALYIESMETNLVPPFMMRLNGLEVNECPKFLAKDPSKEHHSVLFPDQGLRLPFLIEGIVSYLPTRRPDNDELKQCKHLALTPNTPEWDPHTESYKDQENSMMNYRGEVKERSKGEKQLVGAMINQSIASVSTEPDMFAQEIEEMALGVSAVHTTNNKGVKPEDLARRWGIGLELAKRTVKATTQLCVRSGGASLNRRFKSMDRMLRYPRVSTEVFMDTFFAAAGRKSGKSLRGYTCCQLFATPFGHVFPVPMTSKDGKNIAHALKRYFKEVGVPPDLIADGAREQVHEEALKLANEVGCQIKELEKGSHEANRAERYILMVKDESKKDMVNTDSPACLWCYCVERRARIINATARNNLLLQGSCPETMMTGRPCDISDLCEFQWYEWVKFRREGTQYPYPHDMLGKVLGPAKHAGNAMSQYVLLGNGEVIPVQTVRRLYPSEISSEVEIEKRKRFEDAIRKRLGDSLTPPSEDVPEDFVPYEDDETGPEVMPDVDDIPDYDLYLEAEVLLPQDGEHMRAARVTGRVKDEDGKVIGHHNPNPILDTRLYEVMFPDGSTKQYAANIIAEHLHSQVDEDGYRYQLMEAIMDHRRTGEAVERADGFYTTKNGNQCRRQTTKGWMFNVAWKDGMESWIPLKDMKDAYPIEVAEYAKVHNLLEEPAFAWWAPYVLKKRDNIVSAVKSRVKKKTHKYGIEVPNTVVEAYQIDERNGNTLWRDAVKKEMANNRVAFKVLEEDERAPPTYKKLECHMVFDIKMDFTRKARFVANGAKTPDPKESCYAGVVSRETVRIAFTHAALMGIDIFASDIQNAYLQAPTTEKYWMVCGPEFGSEEEGRTALVVRALYGMKSAGRDFRNHLRDCMNHLGYESCKADPDIWMRNTRKDSGEECYEYLLLYVDDSLSYGPNPKAQLEELDKYFPMKPGSIGPPKIYLGAKVSKVQLPNGVEAFAMSSSQYVQEAVRNVEEFLRKRNMALNRGGKWELTPLCRDYRPELDVSNTLDANDAAYYQSLIGLIGILRWMVEMGRFDIATEVSMMSSFVAMPREGHLQQLFRMFAYLKAHHNARVVFDPSYPEMEESDFPKRDWTSMYGENMKEDVPPNAPDALGMEFVIRAYVDADHAGDKVTRRSRTGFIVFLNSAPIYVVSRKQTSVETSSFGSEFCAMKQCCEYLRGLRYKLRMMGIPVNNPSFIYGDNQSVLWNTSVPDSMLKKKSNSIAYHFVREGVVRDEWRTAYVNTKDNASDLMTKCLHGPDRKRKVRMVMYDIYPEDLD